MNSLISAIKAFVLKNRPAYKDYLGNGKYDVKKLPEECVPDTVTDKIGKAQSTAEAAQSTAEAAQSTAEAAQSTAEAAQSTATAAKSTAEAAQSAAESSRIAPNAYNYDAFQVSRYGKYKGWFESIPMLKYDKTNGKFHKSAWETDALTHENIPKYFVIRQDNLQLGLGPEETLMICSISFMSSSNKWCVSGVGIGEKGSRVIAKTQYISLSESTGFVFEYTSPKETILRSSTSGSTKKFKITVDDTGTLKATEVT